MDPHTHTHTQTITTDGLIGRNRQNIIIVTIFCFPIYLFPFCFVLFYPGAMCSMVMHFHCLVQVSHADTKCLINGISRMVDVFPLSLHTRRHTCTPPPPPPHFVGLVNEFSNHHNDDAEESKYRI